MTTPRSFQEGDFNLPLAEYRDHHRLVRPDKDLWENNGWFVMGTTGDRGGPETDVVLWVSPYLVMGRPGGPFTVRDVVVHQTLLIAADYPPAERDLMHDNPFVSVGWDPGDFLEPDALRVEEEPDAVTWRLGAREYVAAPPVWLIRGEHAGVGLDLRCDALAPAFWFTDPAADLLTTEDRWIYVQARATGTVRVGDRTLRIRGHGSHERHTRLGTRYDPLELYAGAGVYWHNVCAEEYQMMAVARPSLGIAYGKVILADRVLSFEGPAAVRIDELARWPDPRSGYYLPYRWRVRMQSPDATLEAEATAFARAYYVWHHLTRGCTLLYFWTARCNAELRLADGRRVRVDDAQYGVHSNRTFQQRETIE
ncbi:MAG TPA: hypothetical protein VGM69_06640 [Chloroflexota bacterium]